ncbi:glutathione S-transferase theta-1-like [Dryobates pubescens]|uniref:glutathione S-transferase theta-1-like n=1 Tax=Dryobates pubescens TaxID=118200 RepID=UPI0023B90586|nr:glutathione S-transferase theta-1-like [Dryobates pubescens]
MGLELYLDLISQPCRAVYIFARSNNIPFEFKHVELLKGQQRTEEFRKVNLLMTVPALKDDSFTLAESIAIFLYLARKFKTPDHWYPADLQKRARVDEYMAWQHTTIHAKAGIILVQKMLTLIITGKPVPAEKMQSLIEELNVVLSQFEEKFLQDKPFIAGTEVSLADLLALEDLVQPLSAGHDPFEGRPKLAEWRQRVEGAVGKQLCQEAHQVLLNSSNPSADKLPPEVLEHLKKKYLQ